MQALSGEAGKLAGVLVEGDEVSEARCPVVQGGDVIAVGGFGVDQGNQIGDGVAAGGVPPCIEAGEEAGGRWMFGRALPQRDPKEYSRGGRSGRDRRAGTDPGRCRSPAHRAQTACFGFALRDPRLFGTDQGNEWRTSFRHRLAS